MPRKMRRPGSALARSFIIVVCLVLLMPFTSLAQSADEAALRRLAEQFFAAYQNRDLNSLIALWSDKSPGLAAAKQSFEQTFAANKLELKSLTFRKIRVEEGKVSVRVTVEIGAVDVKTGIAASGFGKANRTLECVREGEVWKVLRYAPSEDDLAAALISVKTDEERKALLAAEADLITIELGSALRQQGSTFYGQGDYPRALDTYRLARDVTIQIGDKRGTAAAVRWIGIVHYSQNNLTVALDNYQTSLKISEAIGDDIGSSRTLNLIGLVYQSNGDFERAFENLEKSMRISERLDDKVLLAAALGNIGIVYEMKGEYVRALEYHHKSMRIQEEVGDRARLAGTLNNIGIVRRLQGNYIQALECYQRSLTIHEEMGNKAEAAGTLGNIGVICQFQGNYAQALARYQESLSISRELGAWDKVASALGNIGNVYELQGNYVQALEYLQECLKIKETAGDKFGTALTLNSIGSVYHLQGKYDQALEKYHESLAISEGIGDKGNIGRTLHNVGEAYRLLGKHSQAIMIEDRAAVIARQIGSLETLWDARTTAGQAHRSLNQPEEARRAFAEAIAAVEELLRQVAGGQQQQQSFFEDKTSPYYQMIELLIDQKELVQAFEYAERVKGRALLATLQSGRVNITRAMTASEQDEERKLNGEVNSLNIQITREKVRGQPDQVRLADLDARLQKARLDQERFEISLYAAHPELKVHRGQMQPISLEQASRLIPDTDTALLEFVVAEDKTQLFVLTRHPDVKGQHLVATPILKVYTLNIKQKELADRVEKFRARLANQDFLFQEPARELYDLLLGPARAELQNKTNLIIVPDGVLWELPFHALQPAMKRFLIESCAISYAPSLSVLVEMTRAHSTFAINSPRLLALGNPAIGQQTAKRITSVLMDERLDPLPEAERQVKELAKLYGPQRSKIYIGPEAQEVRVKTEAGGYGILHLAAHGILNDKNPMYSQVVLSQPEGDINEDGMLEAWEVMKLDLKADLVVLSACETARGKVGNGEGMIGLSWAFFVAGVPTTVASQWSVESASTTELMVEFHRNLERHKSKAESLRQAMLKLLKSKEYSRPFYWAGFVVVGNGR